MFITEIFKSIQGEGTSAGLPCIFVRLTGCNLRCTWCDTAYAFHGGKKMSVEDVLARVDEMAGRTGDLPGSQAHVPLVELTGGEPLLQEDLQRGTTPKARPVRIYYITQAKIAPPSFLIFTNQKAPLHFSYERFLENQVRAKFDFIGTPIRFIQRLRKREKREKQPEYDD